MLPAARLFAGSRAFFRAAAAAASATSQTAAPTTARSRALSAAAAAANSNGSNGNGSNNNTTDGAAALYLTSPEGGARGATPLLLGLMNHLERHLPDVGYFLPVGSPRSERDPSTGLDRRAALVAAASDHRALGDPRDMVAVPEEEAALLIASGRTSELLDRIYAAYANIRDRHDMVVVEGTGVGGAEFEAQVAAALGTPVLLTLDAMQLQHRHQVQHPVLAAAEAAVAAGQQQQRPSGVASSSGSSSATTTATTPVADRLAAGEIFGAAMLKRQLLLDHGVPLLGVAVNRAPASEHALLVQQLRRRFGVAGVTFAGAIPEDPVLSGVRLGEVQDRLGASLLYGGDGVAGGGGPNPTAGGSGHIILPSSLPLSGAAGASSASSGTVPPELLATGQLQLHVDREFNTVVVASQRLEELLEALEALPAGRRPLVVTTVDRLDLVLGLLAAHVSVSGPPVAGIMLCPTAAGGEGGASAGSPLLFGETSHHPRSPHAFARRAVQRIFEGVARGGMYRGALLPVLATGAPVFDVVRALGEMGGQITPTSATKIRQCRNLFDRYIDADALVVQLERLATSSAAAGKRVTPKMFQHSIAAACQRNPQRIVLPEGTDARVLAAAAEATARGLARITLLGDPAAVRAEAGKLGLDISRCEIVDPATSDRAQAYAELYTSIRSAGRSSSKGGDATAGSKKPARPPPTLEASLEAVRSDVNLFGVMMVRAGAADGMVSGAAHTTAATVRPAMQVLRKREGEDGGEDEWVGAAGGGAAAPSAIPAAMRGLVSSLFFMCLPDRVVVFCDCALVVSPTAEELAAIAVASADTATAFGIEPRIAMLSYSTLGSGSGPEVERVAKATTLVKAWRPDLAVEGPLQYDAAVDPAVAKLKVKGESAVAGKATVLVFPDLQSGNISYKSVQQSSGAIAMGPVLQNLMLPVNDLSRGCTVKDVISTLVVTSVQAQQAKQAAAAAARAA